MNRTNMWPLNICVENSEEARKMFKSHPNKEKEELSAASPKLWKKRPHEASFNNNSF